MNVRRGALAAALVVSALVVAACSGDDPAPMAAAPGLPAPTPTPDPTCPLSGRALPSNVSVEDPAVAVKIENSPAARPQHGLDDADVVYEEIVEGGITRFMALFHCRFTDKAGPVRSARFDDPKIAMPFTRILAFSGSNAIVEAELASRGMAALDEDSGPAFYRDPAGVFEVHNLFVNTAQLIDLAPRKQRTPPAVGVFAFGELDPGAVKARLVRVNFTPSNTIEYRWKGGEWKRWEAGVPFMDADGEQIGVPNVLIQQVRVDNSKHIVDSAGNPSPDIDLVGRGKVLLFRDGSVIVGRWAVEKDGGPPRFTTSDGEPMAFAEGPIWIELVPSPKGTVKGSFSYR